MSELCGNMKPGDIAVMDRAYVDYVQLNTLTEKGALWAKLSVNLIVSRYGTAEERLPPFCSML